VSGDAKAVADVVMIHVWRGHRRVCQASLSGETLLVSWGVAGDYECSLRSGRLRGSARVSMWRMRRNDLAFFRKAAGWRQSEKTACHAAAAAKREEPSEGWTFGSKKEQQA
jgi:hypothetical protein